MTDTEAEYLYKYVVLKALGQILSYVIFKMDRFEHKAYKSLQKKLDTAILHYRGKLLECRKT